MGLLADTTFRDGQDMDTGTDGQVRVAAEVRRVRR